jgi:hypothetical protein
MWGMKQMPAAHRPEIELSPPVLWQDGQKFINWRQTMLSEKEELWSL